MKASFLVIAFMVTGFAVFTNNMFQIPKETQKSKQNPKF